MLDSLTDIFAKSAQLHQVIFVAAIIFFVMASLRSIKHDEMDSGLNIALAFFFLAGHVLSVTFFPNDSPVANPFKSLDVWQWMVMLAAPAFIILFVTMGTMHLCFYRIRQGSYSLFFGSSLACYMYWLGAGWPPDVKAFIALAFGLTWFKLELDPKI